MEVVHHTFVLLGLSLRSFAILTVVRYYTTEVCRKGTVLLSYVETPTTPEYTAEA
jgi:hypothetical protein